MAGTEKTNQENGSDHRNPASLYLSLGAHLIPRFFQLLQRGFLVKARLGCSVKTMLCQQLGLSPEYLEDRIQTIFLDGKPVDDVDSAVITHGSTLALSAAMPGLAGATLRRGGFFAGMRSQITHREEEKPIPDEEGMIVLKLFNLPARELGPTFLEKGIWIRKEALDHFFKSQSGDFWAECQEAKAGRKELDLDASPGVKWLDMQTLVHLRVVPSP